MAVVSAAGVGQRLAQIRRRDPAERHLGLGLFVASLALALAITAIAFFVALPIEFFWRNAGDSAWHVAVGRSAWHGFGAFCVVTSPISRDDAAERPAC